MGLGILARGGGRRVLKRRVVLVHVFEKGIWYIFQRGGKIGTGSRAGGGFGEG